MRWQNSGKLLIVCLAICLAWGWVLPRMADTPRHRRHLQRLHNAGVNPNALFYTDHPQAAEELLR